jgi:hypothetical protein
MTLKNILLVGVIFSSLVLSGCKDHDDPEPVNEEELITTVKLIFTEADNAGATPLTFVWKDLDGSGSAAPEIDDIALKANTAYTMKLELLDESKNPAGNITEEVEEEAGEHQFFFDVEGLTISIAYSDEDGDGNPVGLDNDITTGAAGTGSLTVTLRHEPDKSAAGVSAGDIANAGGETDIQVTFDVSLQE